MNKLLLTTLCLVGLSACGQPRVEVVVPLGIVNVSPHDGAIGIATDAVPTVCFNREMDVTAATGALTLRVEGESSDVPGLGIKATAVAECLALDHEALLANTSYVIVVSKGLAAADDTRFAADVTSHFRTATAP
ncbi:MAG: Ig-like domain-containing protein [Myxococcales bacterium]